MPLDKRYIQELVNRYERGTLSDAEVDAFYDMVGHDEVQELLAESFEKNRAIDFAGLLGEQKKELLLQAIMKRREALAPMHSIPSLTEDRPSLTGRRRLLKTTWRRAGFKYAAAILLLVIGASLYYIFHTPQSQTEVVRNTPPSVPGLDVLPGSDRAVLTLSNGQQVQLNNAASETINDGNLSIKNTNGQLVYSPGGGAVLLNTMTTPRGGQYQLTLADGTRVWLNAASSITYPTAFTGTARMVNITGEAYFEVAKNKEKPFIVKTPKEEIAVLGTSFNVNAYANEAFKTSLLEGAIKISNSILKPGQAFTNGKVTGTDTQQDIAWKNGVFNFDNLPAEAAIRQLARWYDVEIVYDGTIPRKTLGGKMGRNLTLQQALKVLDGVIANFRLEGKELHVSPL